MAVTTIGTRVWAAVTAALLGVLLLPSAGGAAAGDSLNGLGRLTLEGATMSFNVNARSGAAGEGASGTIRIERTGVHTFDGIADVVCLRVNENTATAVGRLREPVPNPNVPGTTYQYVLLWVTDNGPPGMAADEINSGVVWGSPGGAGEPGCAGFVGGLPSEAGNLRVADSA